MDRKIGEKSIVYKHLIVKNGSNVAEGHVVDVLTDLNGKPVKLPDEWKKNLSKYKIT
jgi:Predicted thioesterase